MEKRGLMPRREPAQGNGAPMPERGGAPATQQGQQQGGGQASPQEQALYEQTIDNALRIIYSEKTFPQVIQRMKAAVAASTPQEALSGIVAMAMSRVDKSAQENGQQLGRQLVLEAMAEIVADLAQTAEKAGIHQFSQEEIDGAFYRAVDQFRQYKQENGELDQGRYQEEMRRLVEADRAGQLDQAMPGLKDHFARKRQAEGGEGEQRRPAEDEERKRG
jgi:hypothetical protein